MENHRNQAPGDYNGFCVEVETRPTSAYFVLIKAHTLISVLAYEKT